MFHSKNVCYSIDIPSCKKRGKITTIKLSQLWITSPHRIKIKMEFNPCVISDSSYKGLSELMKNQQSIIDTSVFPYNTFSGLPHIKITAFNYIEDKKLFDLKYYDVCPIIRHVYNVLANSSDIKFEFIMNWLASILQEKKKQKICLVFTGAHGVGKGLFVRKIQEIIVFWRRISRADQFISRHNGILYSSQIELVAYHLNILDVLMRTL